MNEWKPNIRLGPINRIMRFVVGSMIAIFAYALDISTFQFAVHHIITLVFWMSAAYAWDPFYSFYQYLRQRYEDYQVMRGKF